jgi:hypothetical protein
MDIDITFLKRDINIDISNAQLIESKMISHLLSDVPTTDDMPY